MVKRRSLPCLTSSCGLGFQPTRLRRSGPLRNTRGGRCCGRAARSDSWRHGSTPMTAPGGDGRWSSPTTSAAPRIGSTRPEPQALTGPVRPGGRGHLGELFDRALAGSVGRGPRGGSGGIERRQCAARGAGDHATDRGRAGARRTCLDSSCLDVPHRGVVTWFDADVHETPADLAALQDLLDRSYATAGPHLLSIITPERR